ncbi:hypothetical protein ALMP_69980 [Streptomyces sp. A012304]|nr:hypothetical protein ALMP_69980 [Streptomyces sp. A012304]
MVFRHDDGERFASLLRRAAQRPSPRSQIAVVLGDRLISAPAVTAPVSDSRAQIAGGFTEAFAKQPAEDLGARQRPAPAGRGQEGPSGRREVTSPTDTLARPAGA